MLKRIHCLLAEAVTASLKDATTTAEGNYFTEIMDCIIVISAVFVKLPIRAPEQHQIYLSELHN